MKVYDKDKWQTAFVCIECRTEMARTCPSCGGTLSEHVAKRWCYTQKPSFWREVKEVLSQRDGYWEYSI